MPLGRYLSPMVLGRMPKLEVVLEVFESHKLGKVMMFIPSATIAQRSGRLFPTMRPLLTKGVE
jgi:hypothetical protein